MPKLGCCHFLACVKILFWTCKVLSSELSIMQWKCFAEKRSRDILQSVRKVVSFYHFKCLCVVTYQYFSSLHQTTQALFRMVHLHIHLLFTACDKIKLLFLVFLRDSNSKNAKSHQQPNPTAIEATKFAGHIIIFFSFFLSFFLENQLAVISTVLNKHFCVPDWSFASFSIVNKAFLSCCEEIIRGWRFKERIRGKRIGMWTQKCLWMGKLKDVHY